MSTNIAKRLFFAVTLAVAAAGAQAAGFSHVGVRDPYTDGARSMQEVRDPYNAGAHSVHKPRSPFSDGARAAEPFSERARTLAGLDRTGVSADPARSFDPYTDGALIVANSE